MDDDKVTMDRDDCATAMEDAGDPEINQHENIDNADNADQAQPNDPPAPGPKRVLAPDESVEVDPARVIEALLFASDAPLSANRLAELVGAGTRKDVERTIADLNHKYAQAGLTFRIESIARGYQMLTLPEFRPWLAKMDRQRLQTRLSNAALETLSVVAYKQPIIRADIEAIRGVGCGEVLNRLREMALIKIVGRADIVGRPILYGTTRKFLDLFGLADLDDLPPMEALSLRRRNKPEPEDAQHEEHRAAAGA